MICTTIQNRNLEQILELLETCGMAEIRLDRCGLSMNEIDECFMSDTPLVATCRIAEIMASEPALQDERLTPQSKEIKAAQIAEKRLCRAIEAGARYVDVEIEAPKQMSKRVRSVAHENGTVFIRSYHDFQGTDSLEALKAIVEKCCYHGADMVKIVTTAHSQEDVDRVMALYAWCKEAGEEQERISALADGGLVAFCMGEAGRDSRLDCLRFGAPYTYASVNEEEAAAPGQWPTEDMRAKVYGNFHFISPDMVSGQLTMPASKSFAQRAIIAAALSDGVSHLRGYTPCGDSEAALQVARNLGAEVTRNDSEIIIKGISAAAGEVNQDKLDVGESGLLTRMMIPVMAQLCPSSVSFTGERTLLGRPLTGAREIMEAFGAEMTSEGAAEEAPVCVPLTVKGPLKGHKVEISGSHGSQLISGLLMALPFAPGNTTLVVTDPKSIPYMFITLEVLKKFGIKIANDMFGERDFLESDGDWSLCSEIVFKVKGGRRYKAVDMDLEGDWSAAANFLVAGAVFGKVEVEGLDTTSLQADLSIMDILMDAGASLSQTEDPIGVVTAQRAPLRSFRVDASNCPDLFPIVSVLAAFCQGTSRIAGVGRLANKESDRAKAILEMLNKMGVEADIEGDELVVKGYTLAQRLLNSAAGASEPGLLNGGDYTSHHDHRMVMALKVASLGTDGPVVIDDEDCVSKSFPQFLELFGSMACSQKELGTVNK